MEEELRKTFVELVKFAQQVGPDVWAIMVKQQIISGIFTIALWMLACVSFVGSYKLYKKADCEMGLAVGITGCVLWGFGISVLTVVVFVDAFPKLLNPQYYALMALKP